MVVLMKCSTCAGYGKLIRRAPEGMPETYLPYGYLRPFDCPDCKGTGVVE